MKLESFRIEKETLDAINTITKLKPIRGGKSAYYRQAVQEKVARDKKRFQELSKAMNG